MAAKNQGVKESQEIKKENKILQIFFSSGKNQKQKEQNLPLEVQMPVHMKSVNVCKGATEYHGNYSTNLFLQQILKIREIGMIGLVWLHVYVGLKEGWPKENFSRNLNILSKTIFTWTKGREPPPSPDSVNLI